MRAALPSPPVVGPRYLLATFRRTEHRERLPRYQARGNAAHAGVAALCAERPIRNDQISRFALVHLVLKRLI